MTGFQLIAITPLANCSTEFCKKLVPGKAYTFYHNYQIQLDEKHEKVIEVNETESTIPSDLYNLPNGIEVNISAVVGKNGTGKSTLFELLAHFIYIIATNKKIGKHEIIKSTVEEMVEKHDALQKDADLLVMWRNLLIEQNKTQEKIKMKLPGSLSAELIKIIEKHDLQIDFSRSKSYLDTIRRINDAIGTQIVRNLADIKDEVKYNESVASELNYR